MNKITEKINKLVLPATILIASIILGGFFYASQINKQRSIEKQQQIKLQDDRMEEEARIEREKIEKEARAEQDKKEYVAKRKLECYDIEQKERKNWNNVDSSSYNEEKDICVVQYKSDKPAKTQEQCKEIIKDVSKDNFFADMIWNHYYNCLDNTFSKEF